METPTPSPDPNNAGVPTPAPVPTPDAAAPNVTGAPTGVPTVPTSQVGAPQTPQQPAAPPKETFKEGMTRGVRGQQYVVDGQGNVVPVRTNQDSGAGTFGRILAGVAMGALEGARRARPGKIPSQEIGGGFGAGVNAGIEGQQQQDAKNRAKAQQDFANQSAVKKMSREDAESAAQINHLAAMTAQTTQASQFANDEHPLIMAAHKAGLDEAAQRIQKNAQEMLTNSFNLAQTLGEVLPPEAVSAILTNWNDAKGHIPNVVQGKTLPLHNGEEGADGAVGMYDVQSLRNMRLPKDVTYKEYTSDKDGNPVAYDKTLKAGASMMDYVMGAMAGNGQLQKINSQAAVKLAADVHRADIEEKNASANQKNAEAWATTHPGMIQGGGGTAVMTDDMKAKIGALAPDKQAVLSKYDGNTQAALMSIMESPGDIQFDKLFPSRPLKGSGVLAGAQAEGVLSQLMGRPFSQQEYKRMQAAYKEATEGPDGRAIQNYGNVLQHMASAQDVFEKYRQGTPKLLNSAINKLQHEGFGTQAEEIRASLAPVRNEFSLLMSGGYSPKGDEQKAIDTIMSDDMNAAQIEAAFKTLGNTGTIRLDNINENYKRSSNGRDLPGLVSQNTIDAANHLNLEPAAKARLSKFNTGGTFFGPQGHPVGAGGGGTPSPAATGPIYATAPGKPRLMSSDGGKTWQTAQ